MARGCVEWGTVIFFRQGFPLVLNTHVNKEECKLTVCIAETCS
jgi:hypothetical protein